MAQARKDQQSTIDLLPEDIRTKLQKLLRDPRVTQLDATRKINAVLEAQAAAGTLPEDAPQKLYKSSVNRYYLKMKKIGERIRQSREVAQMWIGTLGAEPQGEVGKLLNEMVRNLAFEATTEMLDGEAPIEPKLIKDLAIAIHRLERAASENVKRDEEIRKKALEEATERFGEAAQAQGMDEEQQRFWQEKFLGVR